MDSEGIARLKARLPAYPDTHVVMVRLQRGWIYPDLDSEEIALTVGVLKAALTAENEPTPSPEPAELIRVRVNTPAGLNLRESPPIGDKLGKVIDAYPDGTVLTVKADKIDGWYAVVQTSGFIDHWVTVGYVSAMYVVLEG